MRHRIDEKTLLHQSVQMKFALSYLAIIALVLMLLNTYPIITAQNLVFKEKQTALSAEIQVTTAALSELVDMNRESVHEVMRIVGNNNTTRLVVTNRDGIVLYDTQGDDDTICYFVVQSVTLALKQKDFFRSVYRSGAFRSEAAGPIVCRNTVVGAVYIYEYDEEQAALIGGLQSNLRRFSVLALIVFLALCVALSRALTGRLSRLVSAVHNLREGDYSYRIQVSGRDELASLADDFNDMTERLRQTDEAQRRFVSDASHELKTPLSSIRLLSDSILQTPDIDMETVREFVSDIGEEAERLSRISEHLLLLTRLGQAERLTPECVDLRQTVERVVRMLQPVAGTHRVVVRTILSNGCIVNGIEDDFYQIVLNLAENAVKYNEPGGSVHLQLEHDGGAVELTVADTGIGIPKEEQERVFDRFYRVDKARSRAAGGTGLGLAIVYNAVKRWNGTIAVADRVGGGTVFRVTFPLAKEGMV